MFAENVIRNRKEAINLRRFGIKMGALSAKLESAHRTNEISQTIQTSVPMLQRCMKQMDAMNAGASAASFEQVFEDMDVKTADMNGALDSMTGNSVDNGEVMELLNQMRDQQTMKAKGQINAQAGEIAGPA